ncbi:hypothetical protein FA13DRAFT_1505816 [Coprinellus micaceus]|uniref:Uncharacterized protein n=1 Tax=Coprinellus micaceus TaxID=71717 RepID=A0A4Y7TKU7_COPMI|nr:hypothetical protein FA13DRAFT_1505816 [Coprinellus micaceus]
MPPHPIPSSSAWGKRDVKGKQTRYPLYAPPPNAAAAAELLKAEKKRAIVPSKPVEVSRASRPRGALSFRRRHRRPLSNHSIRITRLTRSRSSTPLRRRRRRLTTIPSIQAVVGVVTTPTPIPVPQIPPRHPSPYLHGSGSADGTHTKPGQSTPREVFLIQERRSSHGATAPLSSSPLAQASFISPMPSSSYSGQDLRPSTSGSSSTSLPSNHERRASSSDSESSVAKPKLTPPRLPTEPERGEIEQKRKPFYRPRPLWLVPFAILAALVRGMTLAPRVEVYTQLACLSPPPYALSTSNNNP